MENRREINDKFKEGGNMDTKKKKKEIYPYKVKVLRMEGNKPIDSFTFDCRSKKEAEKQVSFIKKIVGSKSQTGNNIHILP
jgi:hypothetical protein